MKKIFAIFYLSSLFACSHHQNHHQTIKHVANQKVHCYKQHIAHDDGTSSFVLWYMIMTMNNQSYYYYTSDSPVTNFTTVVWQESKENPITTYDEAEFQQVSEVEVQENQLSQEMQVEMDSSPENFGGMTESELGDYEGGGQESNSDNSTQGSDNSSGGGSDNGSSDGGSSDGGGSDGGEGGDGGGGDGGGGGD